MLPAGIGLADRQLRPALCLFVRVPAVTHQEVLTHRGYAFRMIGASPITPDAVSSAMNSSLMLSRSR